MVENEKELENLVDELKKLSQIAKEIADELPDEYRSQAFSITYRHLLESHRVRIPITTMLGLQKPPVEKSVSTQVEPIPGPAGPSGKLSLVDLVNMLKRKPKSNMEWITLFAYYMRKYGDKPDFVPNDLKEYFKSIGLRVPANIIRDTIEATRKGYLARDPDSKRYYISLKGEELVRGMISGISNE